MVATCGGDTPDGPTASCLVLDPINQRWDANKMESLTVAKDDELVVAATLDNIGVYLAIGLESDFLPAGRMQWQRGPDLPAYAIGPCAVTISPTSFLLFTGGNIWEFDSSVAGPTSNEGWLESNRWPALKKDRLYASCSKVGQKVIITGGQNVRNYESLQSTEVLDLLTKQITSGENLRTAKKCLGAVTIMIGGQERMFSFGGFAQFYIADFGDFDYAYYNEVDEWIEENSNWRPVTSLLQERTSFGAVSVPKQLVCPAH